jgi:hypothetical protein
MNEKDFNKIPEKDRLNRVLTGEAYFASVHRPNTTKVKKWNGLPEYIVNLGVEGAELEKAKSYGLKIYEPTNSIPVQHVRIFRKLKPGADPAKVAPKVVDSMQNPVPDNVLIGNKSKVTVKFGTYFYQNNGGGVNPVLFKVQIRDLVPVDISKDRALTVDEGGFVLAETPEDDTPPFESATIFDDDDGFVDPKEIAS